MQITDIYIYCITDIYKGMCQGKFTIALLFLYNSNEESYDPYYMVMTVEL